jgi:leader peptidase (prepilin peptidase) / N-methyltransferase
MFKLTAILIPILGTIFGSFLSVAIYRIHKQEDIIFSRSNCAHCKTKLRVRDLIPIFSWVFLRGRCAHCSKKIAISYPLLELITAGVFLATFLTWNFLEPVNSAIDGSVVDYYISWPSFQIFLFYLLESLFLIAIFFYDFLHGKIPDRLSLPAIGLGILGGMIFGLPTGIDMLLGALLIGGFFLVQFIISNGKWIGGGDIRLGVLMGVLLGWKGGLTALIISYFLGAAVSIYLLATKKAKGKTSIPFGPFLISGTLITLYFGNEIVSWYFSL